MEIHTSFFGIFFLLCAIISTVSSRTNTIKAQVSQPESQEKGNPQDGDKDDAVFDWQLSTDNVDFYKILHGLDLEDIIKFLENTTKSSNEGDLHAPFRQRQKRRAIFGKNDRRQGITLTQTGVMPYAAAVLISTKCSGTLIGPKHVLTAAHCSFGGDKRKTKIRKLKVGFLYQNGRVRWRKVRKVYAASEWHTISTHQERLRHDYAVLELRREHKRPYMKPVPFHPSPRNILQVNGFPKDKKRNTMWHTYCPNFQQWKGYLISRCHLTGGMSGAGSYLQVHRKKYVVQGLVIATFRLRHKNRRYKFNVVNPLTNKKVRLICQWMKAGHYCRSLGT